MKNMNNIHKNANINKDDIGIFCEQRIEYLIVKVRRKIMIARKNKKIQ